MLVVRPGEGLEDRFVRDLSSLLRPGDALVFNDTRVIPARLYGTRERDGQWSGSRRCCTEDCRRTPGPPSCGPASG